MMNKDGNKQKGLYSWHEVLMLQVLNRLLLLTPPSTSQDYIAF